MVNEVFEYDVFICYHSADQATVHPLAERLREAGLRVWLDAWVVPAGGEILAEIEQGLARSRVCVACMSPEYFSSEWTQLERNSAIFRDPMNNQRRFVPLLLADCDIPDPVRKLRYIDNRNHNDESVDELIAACRAAATPTVASDLQRIQSLAISMGRARSPTRRTGRFAFGMWRRAAVCGLLRDSRFVRSLGVSADGTRVVSASGDHTVSVWDVATGHCLRSLEGHSSIIFGAAVSADGTLKIYSWAKNGIMRVWSEPE